MSRLKPSVPGLETLESRRLMAGDAGPFALVKLFSIQAHLAAVDSSYGHSVTLGFMHAKLEHRLGVAERHLSLAERRLSLMESHQSSSHLPKGPVSSFPAMTRAVNHWASVAQIYRQALGIVPASGGASNGAAVSGKSSGVSNASGAVRAAVASAPTIAIVTAVNPAIQAGSLGTFVVTSSDSTSVAVQVTVQFTGPNASTDGLAVTGNLNPDAVGTNVSGTITGMVTLVSPGSGQAATITLYAVPSGTVSTSTQDDAASATISAASSGCCYCGGGGTPTPIFSPNTASLTIQNTGIVSISVNNSSSATTVGGNTGAPATFDIHYNGNPSCGVTVKLNDAGSTAVPNTDYSYTVTGGSASLSPGNNTVTLPAGTPDALITVTPLAPTIDATKVIQFAVIGGGCSVGAYGVVGYFATPPASAVLTIVKPLIQTVQWVGHTNSPLTQNTNPGLGFQIYPDKDTPTGSDRGLVDFQAQLMLARPGVPIYFRVIDVDDPSANTAPIDDEMSDHDNRGDITQPDAVQYTSTTNAAGLAIIHDFRVSMKPGDNYRVVASLKPFSRTAYTAIQNDVSMNIPLAGINDNTTSPSVRLSFSANTTVASEMLTVWRRLWVQVDTMGVVTAGANHPASGDINNVTAPSPIPGQNTLTTSLMLAPTDNNLYQGGTLTDSVLRSFAIVSNTNPAGGTTTIVVSVPVGSPSPAVGPFTIIDDDIFKPGDDLGLPNLSTLPSAMVKAYVTPGYIPNAYGNPGSHAPFKLNVASDSYSVNQIVTPQWVSRQYNATDYWVAYILEAFEGAAGADNDPDTEVAIGGETSVNGGSLIFKEQNADIARQYGTISAFDSEADTVVHEVAHAVGNISAPGGTDPWGLTLINYTPPPPSQPSVYDPRTIVMIRKASKPWS